MTHLCASPQADQVPTKARAIAESATTSILLQQNVAQQHELMEKDRIIGELKCGLMITCNALKETNYMEEEVRTGHQAHLIYVTGLRQAASRQWQLTDKYTHMALGIGC
jgi:hypothetical protein